MFIVVFIFRLNFPILENFQMNLPDIIQAKPKQTYSNNRLEITQVWIRVWCYLHFQQYFSYIVAVSFIGGGNRSTPRKSLTGHKSLTNFIT